MTNFIKSNERFKQVRENTGLTQPEFGEKLGLSQVNIKDIEIGRKKVTPEIALEVEKIYGTNFKWLLTGEEPVMAAEPSAQYRQSPRTAALLGNFEALSDEDKKALERIAFTLAQSQKKVKNAV